MESTYKKIKQWYDENTDSYAKKSGILLYKQLNYFISRVSPNGQILDIGCGPGHDTDYFSKKGFHAIGIDFSKNMLRYAQKHRTAGIFKNINILEIDRHFNKNYFDGIWSSSSLTHLKKSDITKTLKKIKLVTAPQCPIIIIVKQKTKRKNVKRKIIFNEFYKKDILKHLKQSGLFTKKIKTFTALGYKWLFVHAEKRIA